MAFGPPWARTVLLLGAFFCQGPEARAPSPTPLGVFVAGLLLIAGCDGAGGSDVGPHAAESVSDLESAQAAERAAAPTGSEEQDLVELAAAFEPLDPTLTSDHHDAWIVHQREVQERLRAGGPALGLRALEAFEKLESPRLVNALAQAISFSPIERQQLIEADSIVGRCETLSELLQFRLAATGAPDDGSTPLPN